MADSLGPPADARTRRAVDLCGLLSVVAFAALAATTHRPPLSLSVFFAAWTIAWLSLLSLQAWSARAQTPLPVGRIVFWALAMRAVTLLGVPLLEDDAWRYLWDGRSLVVLGNPYATTPADHFGDPSVPAAFQAVLDRINHPDVPTLYGPVAQAFFALGYLLRAASLVPIRLGLVAADLATFALLIRSLGARRALWWGWCPLVVIEVALHAHIDALGVALVVSALAAWRLRRENLAAIALALAVGVKSFALVPAALLLPRMSWRRTPLFLAVVAALHTPFWADGGGAGLLTFAREWEFNSIGYAPLAWLVGWESARGLAVALFGACVAALAWRGRSPGPAVAVRGDLAFAALFLLSPVVNPWYLLWMLPFVAERPSGWGLAACMAVALSYAHGLFLPGSGLAPYAHPEWVRPLEMVAVCVAALATHRWRKSPGVGRAAFG